VRNLVKFTYDLKLSRLYYKSTRTKIGTAQQFSISHKYRTETMFMELMTEYMETHICALA